MIKKFCVAAMALCMMLSCAQKQQQKEEAAAPATTLSGLNPADFTSEVDGKPIALYVLKNAKGAEACITNWGRRWVSMMVPDKNGKMTDVVLGYDKLQDYISSTGNFGALIGRYGNRACMADRMALIVRYGMPSN